MLVIVNNVSLYLWVFLLLELSPHGSSQKRTTPTDCEKQAPVAFNAAQKLLLCDGHVGKGDVGPGVCASTAKELLKGSLTVDDIVQLCQGASSSSPAKCIHHISDTTSRKKFGNKLCKGAISALPGECYSYLTKYKTGNHKIDFNEALDFCQSIGDSDGPLDCMKTSLLEKSIASSKAMQFCLNAVGGHNATSHCIRDMKKYTNAQHGLQPMDILPFCASAVPEAYAYHKFDKGTSIDVYLYNFTDDGSGLLSPLAKCFLAASEVKAVGSTTSAFFTSKQKLQLCENAPPMFRGHGPVNCSRLLVSKLSELKIQHGEVINICKSAVTDGPARCFFESKGMGTFEKRMELCNGAMSAGPAHCFRRAQSLFKTDEKSQQMLCVGTDSDAPAQCVTAAPLYLSNEEKVHLCSNAPISRGQEPIQCIQAVESPSKLFRKAPTKGLGHFISGSYGIQPADKVSRELLVNMCSFGGSQSPLASAECIKSAPKSLEHDEATRLCTDISSAEMMTYLPLCMKLLPRDWTTHEAGVLCEHATGREQVEAVIKCAIEVTALTKSSSIIKMNKNQTSALCSQESLDGKVLACTKQALQVSVSSMTISYDSLYNVCGSRKSSSDQAGQCLNKIASMTAATKFDIDDRRVDLARFVCGLPDPLGKLKCLNSKGKRLISTDDVEKCEQERRVPHSVKVIRFLSENDQQYATAGKKFSIALKVLDQWGDLFVSSGSTSNTGIRIFAKINENNPQGAVLWGIKGNETTPQGFLHLDSLVISQPGSVEFKIYYPLEQVNGRSTSVKALGIFAMDIHQDPDAVHSSNCVFMFHRAMCSLYTREEDYIADFPRARSLVPLYQSDYLLAVAYCVPVWQSWHVNVFQMPDATFWVEYKAGVESMWTGVGFPTQEMRFEDRLELNFKIDSLGLEKIPAISGNDVDVIVPMLPNEDEGKESTPSKSSRSPSSRAQQQMQKVKAILKEIRRAYYKKSLQWHPDRWVGMSRYHVAVQGAFELVSEAYEALNDRINNLITVSSPP